MDQQQSHSSQPTGATALPSAGPAAKPLSNPEPYLNRELGWLQFNQRVLLQAADPHIPLLERLKFLAIAGSNLDEFFMKRIGGLKQQADVFEVDGVMAGTLRRSSQQQRMSIRVARNLSFKQPQNAKKNFWIIKNAKEKRP